MPQSTGTVGSHNGFPLSPDDQRERGPPQPSRPGRPVLLLVEGPNDAEFLIRISRVLYRQNVVTVELTQLIESHRLVLTLLGGGIPHEWWNRFALLGCPEFHLYDKEVEPQTAERRKLMELVNTRPGCIARLTSKRSLENYLHPGAIRDASDEEISI